VVVRYKDFETAGCDVHPTYDHNGDGDEVWVGFGQEMAVVS
jgi:hypothetical protein